MTLALVGGFAGIGAGSAMLLLSHLAPRMGGGAVVRDLDAFRLFGRSFSRREAHLFGILFHLALSFVFGAFFAVGVEQGIVSGATFAPLASYVVLLTIFMGGVVMPLEGHGLFGLKEDGWFVLDLLITNILWVILYGLMMGVLV